MGSACAKPPIMCPMNPLFTRSVTATRFRLLATTLAAAGALCLTAATSAFARDDVMVRLTASKVAATKDGKEKFIAAETARPGEVIQYEAAYRNETQREIKGLEATVPIPAGLELLPESFRPVSALASVNGADFAAMPLMKPVADAAGKTVPVPLGEYRALRWAIPQLAPGATAIVKLRARVLTNQSAKALNP